MSGMDDALAPGFLFAVPQLLDPNFVQSVVLLVDHTEEGAFGLVLNHETAVPIAALCQEQQIPFAGDRERKVRRGGPVDPQRGFVLYGQEHDDPDGRRIAEGLGISLSLGTLGRLCVLPRARFAICLGYAGWGPGQLTREIAEGAWLTGPVDPALALDAAPTAMWEGGLRALGIDPAALAPGGTFEA
jgi:putative transcriptional regulator